MTNDTDEEPGSKRKLSVKEYASKVFKESSVSAVSSIVSTGNLWRKIFRVLVFLIFTAGFLCQCIKFLSYVLEYPTIVNIEMDRPARYIGPAYTFCNFNPIKRSKFCLKYPESCFEPDAEFCEKYPKFCVENNSKVPYGDISEKLKDSKVVMELIHDWKDLLEYSYEEPEGPFPRYDEDGYGTAACYTIFSRVNNSLEPEYRQRSMWKGPRNTFLFNPQESDILYPNSKPGILFSIHSPFEAVNPFQQGIFMRPGRLYRISVEMSEEELLPHPYKTDCLNYTDMWLNANKMGPRSQQMCKQKCLKEYLEYCYNCSHPFVLYPIREKEFCIFDMELNITAEICNDFHRYITPCVNKCKEDCTKMKYSYQVQESFQKTNEDYNDTSKIDQEIQVKIIFEDSEIMKIQYKPQFQRVEAFSYIGGFIGIWLGISLVQVADVIESVFLITRYFLKKATTACLRKPDSEITGRGA